jgi:hypothetical protein
MLYREIIAVCSQIHTKHINTLCGQNAAFVNVKLAVLGRPRIRWGDNFKVDLQEVGMDWIELAQDRDIWRAIVNADETSVSVKCAEFLTSWKPVSFS